MLATKATSAAEAAAAVDFMAKEFLASLAITP